MKTRINNTLIPNVNLNSHNAQLKYWIFNSIKIACLGYVCKMYKFNQCILLTALFSLSFISMFALKKKKADDDRACG